MAVVVAAAAVAVAMAVVATDAGSHRLRIFTFRSAHGALSSRKFFLKTLSPFIRLAQKQHCSWAGFVLLTTAKARHSSHKNPAILYISPRISEGRYLWHCYVYPAVSFFFPYRLQPIAFSLGQNRPRQDSNLQPSASEANALSN